MKIFLLDLWHDLQAKRLAPVAVVLAVGLVAVPVVLLKPAEDPAPAPVAAVKVDAAKREQLAALTKVKLGDEKVGAGSTLGVFDPANPFKPPKGAIKKQVASTGSSDEAGPGSAAAGSTGSKGGSDGSLRRRHDRRHARHGWNRPRRRPAPRPPSTSTWST